MQNVGLIVGIIGGILGMAGVITSIVLGVSNNRRAKSAAVRVDCAADTTMQLDIMYIKRGVDDIKVDQRSMRDSVDAVRERVAKVEGRLEDHINMHPPDR